MDIKKNRSQESPSENQSSFDDSFFNSRLCALEHIKRQGNFTIAMLTVDISKVRTFFLFNNYEIRFSVLYFRNGQTFQNKDFYTIEIPGKEGRIPDYILEEINKNGSLAIRFNYKDLSALYAERDIKIDETATFDEITELCKKKDVATIQLIDRGFYTRIECYDSNKDMVGTIHVGALYGLPRDMETRLYPGKTVAYTL
ncbi:MAG: hypothetical protein Q4E55_08950 [Bacteroidales bacterium]|nr:hypothetical protein [Bacteroidales bacterium]